MSELYIVIEGGGVDYDPRIHGIFKSSYHAKTLIKKLLFEFCKSLNVFETAEISAAVKKTVDGNYTYFYVFNDNEEVETFNWVNVFAIVKMQKE